MPGKSRLAVRAAGGDRRLPSRERQRDLAALRQAELRLRAAGSSAARAAVPAGPLGGRTRARHLHELAGILEFMPVDQREEWLAARWRTWATATSTASAPQPAPIPLIGVRERRGGQGPEATLQAADLATVRAAPGDAVGYFENNGPHLRYKWFRSCGLFAGSGVVQAGCKAIIGQRLKLSGMRWTVAVACAIIALRCREASSRWEEIWQRPRNQTATA